MVLHVRVPSWFIQKDSFKWNVQLSKNCKWRKQKQMNFENKKQKKQKQNKKKQKKKKTHEKQNKQPPKPQTFRIEYWNETISKLRYVILLMETSFKLLLMFVDNVFNRQHSILCSQIWVYFMPTEKYSLFCAKLIWKYILSIRFNLVDRELQSTPSYHILKQGNNILLWSHDIE